MSRKLAKAAGWPEPRSSSTGAAQRPSVAANSGADEDVATGADVVDIEDHEQNPMSLEEPTQADGGAGVAEDAALGAAPLSAPLS